jgi:hypothetical protein
MNINISQLDAIFLEKVMLDSGIVPMRNVTHNIDRVLEKLPEDEARKMKRKFRKEWRKLAKASSKYVQITLGFKKSKKRSLVVTKIHKLNRKNLVFNQMLITKAIPFRDAIVNGNVNGNVNSKNVSEE